MATVKSDLPPMHAAETTASSLSSLGNAGGGGGSGSSSSVVGNNSNTTTNSSSASVPTTNTASVNNTISAAADSSDNQPGTPQPQIGVNEQQQQQQSGSSASGTVVAHHPYGTHNMYATASPTTSATLPHMYTGSIYATSTGPGNDIQQQQQQQSYPSYMNSYEQFYQQQGQTQSGNGGTNASGIDYGVASSLYGSGAGGGGPGDYKSNTTSAGVRYHPYLQTPTSNGGAGSGGNSDGHDTTSAAVSSAGLALSTNSAGNAAVSTTTAMSPRVVSSSSPTSTSTQIHIGSGNSGGGNPQSPACGQQLLCKKCGIMCTNEAELQEHITNVHGASPYGSSGYSSSPYIKEELQGAPPGQPQQQQSGGGNPGDILDLDSQKMVYPPIPGSMQSIMGHGGLHHQQHHPMHDPMANDPLHSMHTMQQRSLPGWDQAASMGVPGVGGASGPEGLPAYMQQTDITTKPNQSPYYSPKQSPYHASSGSGPIKHEYPLIKSEYADSQNYVDKSFDPTVASASDMCQQQQNASSQQSMLPVSSSPAEFPSTTTGPSQDQQQSYRGFEPPTSSSVLPATGITAKAATWKSNEARRPKTYNCTACNKWFTSSGHLKRHYNTTLHKNAVKTSGQPDPATLPISAHHHPARDPNGKHSRRGGNNNNAAAAAAAAQQQPPAPVQPPEPPHSPLDYAQQATVVSGGSAGGLGPMSHYSASPSPTQQQNAANGSMPFGQQNGYQQSQQPYLPQVQSSTNVSPQHASHASGAQQPQQSNAVLNGHPNGLAGPSALTTTAATTTTLLMPSSQTRGLLNTTTTTTIIKREISAEEDINTTTINSPMGMEMMDTSIAAEAAQGAAGAAAAVAATASVVELQQHHQLLVKQESPELESGYHLLEQSQPQLRYHNSTPSSRAPSPLIISHQQYQEQLHLQQQQAMAVDSIFSPQQQQAHMLQPPLQLPANTMEAFSIIPLGINTQPQHSSSTQLLPPPPPISTTATTASMLDSIPMLQQHSLPRRRHPLEPEQGLAVAAQLGQVHNTLSNTTITSMPDTQQRINTTITQPQPPHMLTPLPQLQPSITNPIIPSFQQLQPEAPLPLEHTMTYHTIIGSNGTTHTTGNHSSDCDANSSGDLLQLGTFDGYASGSSMLTTADGQIFQFISNGSGLMQPTYFTALPTRTGAVAESYVRSYSSSTQRSPHEADLPPANSQIHFYAQTPQESQTTNTMASAKPHSPTVSSSTAGELLDVKGEEFAPLTPDYHPKNSRAEKSVTKRPKPNRSATKANPAKRKRVANDGIAVVASTVSTTSANVILPSGRIKCLECDKEFTKICYLTQHNKCFHSGEYPYRCEKCGKRFQSEEVYTTHLGRHKTQDKPHKCEICPKQFHHKTDLRRHIEAIHTGNKQHSCEICEKSFCRKDHLRKHLETHNRPRVIQRKAPSRSSATRRKPLTAAEKNTAAAAPFQEKLTDAAIIAAESEVVSQPEFVSSSDHAAIDVLVVIKNERDEMASSLLGAESNFIGMPEMSEVHDEDMIADDEDLLDNDDDDNDNSLLTVLPQMQQQKLLHEHQHPMVVYVNGSVAS